MPRTLSYDTTKNKIGGDYVASVTGYYYASPQEAQYRAMQQAMFYPGWLVYPGGSGSEEKQEKPRKEEKNTMLSNIKEYIKKNNDVIFTFGFVVLVDHFLFQGALRSRIKTFIEGLLTKAEDKLKEKNGQA